MSEMTNEEAIAIIHKEYLCVDMDCDIERSCGKCDLAMPSKEPILKAFKMAMQALETIPKYKDAYNKGWCDGAKATYEHLKMCEEEQEPKYCDRNICIKNEYNGIGCDDCEVTKSQEQRAGHWIATENGFECSECGCISRSRADICQYCSTRMIGEKE